MRNSFFVSLFVFGCAAFFLHQPVYAQPYQPVVKKLTNFNYDSRSAGFFRYPQNRVWLSEIFYTAQYDTSSDICILKYNPQQDTFYQSVPAVRNGFKNIRPEGKQVSSIPDYKRMLLWQTNQRGNQDIAYSLFNDTAWTQPKVLVGTQDNETNPKFIYDGLLNTRYDFDFLFEKNNSVYRCFASPTDTPTVAVFKGTYPGDSIVYTEPTAIRSGTSTTLFVALKKEKNKEPVLVYKYLTNDTLPGNEGVVYTGKGISSAKFFLKPSYSGTWLTFNAIVNNRRALLSLEILNFGNNSAVQEYPDTTGDISDFSYTYMYLVGDNMGRALFPYGAYAYILKRNDSLFVPILQSLATKRLHPLKAKASTTNSGYAANFYRYEGVQSYIIWEDSSDGHINLFGYARYDPFGDASEPGPAEHFGLFAAYPNPFNSETVIRYELKHRASIRLIAYDAAGREAAVLYDGEQREGMHESSFKAGHLPSGVYFLRLQTGASGKTIKTTLLK